MAKTPRNRNGIYVESTILIVVFERFLKNI